MARPRGAFGQPQYVAVASLVCAVIAAFRGAWWFALGFVVLSVILFGTWMLFYERDSSSGDR